jgi:hypothetical protein
MKNDVQLLIIFAALTLTMFHPRLGYALLYGSSLMRFISSFPAGPNEGRNLWLEFSLFHFSAALGASLTIRFMGFQPYRCFILRLLQAD